MITLSLHLAFTLQRTLLFFDFEGALHAFPAPEAQHDQFCCLR
jgi:hypothetical protein